ncbi:MAG TPA: serine/threonine-protein kinase, partial [Actinomycetes bacterium]|nr:serine/threonine-protein kinase [Actinomycetes bacterium]
MTDPVAPRVAGYDVTGRLGAGSGGEVWLGRDRATGEQVALKRVRPGAGLAARDRLRREAAALAGLTHPHVLRLRSVAGCLDAPDDLVLVLDAALGGSLARLVSRHGPRPPGQVVTVLVAVADALTAVRDAGLAHGDVTPSNVLVTADGRPVLGDLGSARLGDASARLGGAGRGADAGGTPGFADPAGVGGPAADVHGLAATCVFLLTGRPAYDRAGARVPLDHDAAADPAVRRLMAVLDTALHADPAARPPASALARAGFDAARPEPLPVDLLDAAPGSAGLGGAGGPGVPVDDASEATSWGVPITQLSRGRWAGASGTALVGDPSRPAAGPAEPRGRRRGAHARPRPARTLGSRWAALRTRLSARSSARSWPASRRRGVAALGTAVAVAL